MVASTLFRMPFELFSAFIVDDNYGFNKQTMGYFALTVEPS